MGLSIGEVVATFDANIKGFDAGIKKAESQMAGFSGAVSKASSKIGKTFIDIGKTAAKFGAVMGGLGLAAGVGTLKVAGDVQTMKVALKSAFRGSQEEADKAYKTVKDFSDRTPYMMGEVLDSFIKLKNLGLDPSNEALEAYGNTASSMGKSLDQMIEAVADASTGEFERLKEFGIRSSKEGDRVKFTFQGVTKEVGFNSDEIQKYLMDLGKINFAGGMEAQSQTLAGRLSTLKGNFLGAVNSIAEDSGLLAFATDAVLKLSDAIKGISFESIKNGFKALKGALTFVFGDGYVDDWIEFSGQDEDQPITHFLWHLSTGFTALKEAINQVITPIREFFVRYIQAFIPTLQIFAGILLVLATQVLASLKYAWEQLKPAVEELIAAFSDFWEQIQPILQGVAIILTAVLVPAFQFVFATVVQVFKGIIQMVTGLLTFWAGVIKTVFGAIVGIITGDFTLLGQGIKQMFNGLIKYLEGYGRIFLSPFIAIIDGIRNIFTGIDFFKIAVSWIESLISGIRSKIGGAGNAIKEGIGRLVPEGVRKLIPGFANGVRNFAGGLAIVGERGPELVNLPQGADVFSNQESKGMMGGAGITIENMNIKSNVDWQLGTQYMAQKLRLS